MGPSRVLIRRVIVLLGLVLEASFVGAAADDRPTVALVLGGGSARGLAHVGVLEWLEDHRIPVDIVVGTSMGGLVGGAYATGRSPAEIKAILGSANWDLLFLGDVQFPLKTFRRKEDRRSYPFVELGLRGGLSLPSGLDPGHQIGLFLSRLALDQSPITDFDDLPIPFRCVAVDIERGEQVVLGSGSLGHSLRATMSIPGVFAPIEIDGRLLADGGLLSNVPTSVAKDLGADVVIAVSVGAGLVDRDALGSPLALIGQSLTVMMLENTRRELELADIVIEPELDGVGSTAWRQFEQIARRGYDAAAQRGEALSAFALNDAAWAAHLARRQARGLSNPFRPTTVTVDGLDPLEREAMQVALQDHVDRPLDPGRLEEQLTVIAGAGRYESLRYGVRRDRGTDDLRIDVTPKAHGPPFVNLGIDIGDLEGDIDFNFGARITAYDVLVPRAETRLDLAIGSRNGARAEYYLPLGDTRWFVAPSTSHEKRTQNFFRDGDLIATYGTRRSAGGSDLGFTLGPSSEVRAGYQVTYLDSSVTIGDPFLPEVSGREQIARIRWVYDGADRWIVPQRGVRMSSVVRAILDPADGAAGFPQAEAEVTIFRPIGSGDRVAATLRGGTSFDNDPSAFYEFTLGGPLRLGAFDVDEFRGNHFLYSSFWYLRTIGRLPDILGGSIFLAGWAEAGSAFERLRAARFKSNLSTGVVIETFVGPVTFAGSVGDDGSSAFYFSIGGLLAR